MYLENVISAWGHLAVQISLDWLAQATIQAIKIVNSQSWGRPRVRMSLWSCGWEVVSTSWV
jgi:hypothetical protein